MDAGIFPHALKQALASADAPLVIDVRREPVYRDAPDMIAGALRRDPASAASWRDEWPAASRIAVYCVHGHDVSQDAAKALRGRGLTAHFVEGGLEAWRRTGGDLVGKPVGASTRWVTRERPKIDRIACPWLILRFIDTNAEFLYVPQSEVRAKAVESAAIPYDVPDVRFSHEGDHCSFDAFLRHYRLKDPALDRLAHIVRGADTARLEMAPQAPGLLAISLGLSRLFADDHRMLEHGMILYDALYLWCREGQSETHTWNPEAYR